MHMHITKAGKNSVFRRIEGTKAVVGKNRRNRNTKAVIFIDMDQINIQLFHGIFLLFDIKKGQNRSFPEGRGKL
jgi:hypothetical protein